MMQLCFISLFLLLHCKRKADDRDFFSIYCWGRSNCKATKKECCRGSEVHQTWMLICYTSQSLTVRTTHTNRGTSKCRYKTCDKHYLLPWCKLQTHGHFLTEISFHHATFGENPGAGSTQTWPLPDHMVSLWQVTENSIKALGRTRWCWHNGERDFTETSARPGMVTKNYPILKSCCI